MMDTLEKWIEQLARMMAIAGGLVLLALIVLTCLSITGRSLIWARHLIWEGLGPIPGDFEMVEMGVGFAVFSFLPWCHLKGGNARVDLFKDFLGKGVNRLIEIVTNLLMLGVSGLIAWRLWYGMLDKHGYTETTFILQFPIWIGYAAAMVGACVFVLVSVYCVLRSFLKPDAAA